MLDDDLGFLEEPASVPADVRLSTLAPVPVAAPDPSKDGQRGPPGVQVAIHPPQLRSAAPVR